MEHEHPSVYIREEMDARDWGTPSMARHMGGDYQTSLFAIEMYLSIGATLPELRLGGMAEEIARAFGTSVETWRNLEAAWLRSKICAVSHQNTGAMEAEGEPPQSLEQKGSEQ